jgi:hypothetical protein
MYKEIERLDADLLVRENLDELATKFSAEEHIKVPRLKEEDNWSADHQDAQVRVNLGGGSYALVPGLRSTIHVPFEGHSWVFNVKPSTFSTSGRPYVHDIASASDELVIVLESRYFESEGYNQQATRVQLDTVLGEICQHLTWISREVEPYNVSLHEWARTRLENRRKKLLKDRSFAESLGIPLKRRKDAPKTHEIPLVRKVSPIAPHDKLPLHQQN